MKRRYGITAFQYDVMHKKQSGLCAICLQPKKLSVDHCHRSRKVRGLLCNHCNLGIGHFFENLENLGRAIQYLTLSGE